MRRREFVITSIAVAGGVGFGGYYLLKPETRSNPLTSTLFEGQVAITPYVIIDDKGVTIITPRAEMGQGVHSTLATLVAEELDIPVDQVIVEHGPPSAVYANNIAYRPENYRKRLLRRVSNRIGINLVKVRHPQLTGGQTSMQDAYVKMRKAGAAARLVLIGAAAREFGIEKEKLRTENGAVVHPNGTRISYTQLADRAADIVPPMNPKLKPREKWTQLGTSQNRVDMLSKCTGTATFAIDVRLPEMLYATALLNPHIGGGLQSFDASKASKSKGFVQAVPLQDGIVVVATNTWYAMQAAKLIEVEWGPAPYPATNEEHRSVLLEAMNNRRGQEFRNDGDVDAVFDKSEVIEGIYHVPYLAHATMEPMNAVAWLRDGKLDIWAGNQNPCKAQYFGSQIANIPRDAVKVHTTYMGGGFGRRLAQDFVKIAIQAACAVEGTPVKVTWSRETDMTHDVYRPLATSRFRYVVSNGQPVALDLKLASPSLKTSSSRRRKGIHKTVDEYLDKFSTAGASDQPYNIDNYRVTAYPTEQLLPVGWLRGVGESQNVFFHDCAIDELVHACGADPFKMRLSLIKHAPSRSVLERVAAMSNWGSPLPKGHARGIAYALSSGAATAQVIEVSGDRDNIHIEKVFAVVDVGIALDPRNIEAQVQSAIIFGLCAAMYGEISVDNSQVKQTNFHDYMILRMNQVPPISVGIYESQSEIYGVGEAGTPTAPPALGNAIFALTGRRLRELPFANSINFI